MGYQPYFWIHLFTLFRYLSGGVLINPTKMHTLPYRNCKPHTQCTLPSVYFKTLTIGKLVLGNYKQIISN